MVAGLSDTSDPLEKSIGELLSSSNIPNDTKTDEKYFLLVYIVCVGSFIDCQIVLVSWKAK